MSRRSIGSPALVATLVAASLVAHAQQQQEPAEPVEPMAEQTPPPPQPVQPATPAQQIYQNFAVTPEDGWPTAAANPFSRLPPRPAKLAPGDLVVLTLFGLTASGVATPFYLHVDEAGGLSVPLVGVVDVKDQTTDRAAARVSRAMADMQLVRDGVVTIGLLQTAAETGVAAGPLKPGDGVQVTIFDLVGNGRRLVSFAMVGDDGQIELPLGGTLKLDGLTESQADKAVQNRYRDRRILPNATVSVLKLAPPRE